MKYGASLHCSVNRELEVPLAVGWSFADADPSYSLLGLLAGLKTWLAMAWRAAVLVSAALVEESR